MNLQQLFANCNSNSGYSRGEGEIWSAINRAGFNTYSWTLKESRGGFFIKFDESSVTLDPTNATQEYTLPTDCTQIIHIAERLTATENWHPMSPESLSDAVSGLMDSVGWYDYYAPTYGNASDFSYYGPYLDSSQAQNIGNALQVQKIRVSPKPDASRFVQLVYAAKWLPITDANSKLMLPDEATPTVESFASAELCGKSDDVTRRNSFLQQAKDDLAQYLTWVRARQIQASLTIDTYGPGVD